MLISLKAENNITKIPHKTGALEHQLLILLKMLVNFTNLSVISEDLSFFSIANH